MCTLYKIFKRKYGKNKVSNNIVVGDIVMFESTTNFEHLGVVLRINKILKLDMADVLWCDSTVTTCSIISLKRM